MEEIRPLERKIRLMEKLYTPEDLREIGKHHPKLEEKLKSLDAEMRERALIGETDIVFRTDDSFLAAGVISNLVGRGFEVDCSKTGSHSHIKASWGL